MGLIVGALKSFIESLDPFLEDPTTKLYAEDAHKYSTQYLNGDITLPEYTNLMSDLKILSDLGGLDRETSLYIFALSTYNFLQSCRSWL